jgi:hypothetical protein
VSQGNVSKEAFDLVMQALDLADKRLAIYYCVRNDTLGRHKSPHHLSYFLRITRAR